MSKAAVGLGLLVLLFGPASALLSLAAVLNPAAQASCLPETAITVGAVPDHLLATTTSGVAVRLQRTQLQRAATTVSVGLAAGAGRDGVEVALMAALTESSRRMLSNAAAYPESATLPNDGDGSDHDSLGMFQMRPSTG